MPFHKGLRAIMASVSCESCLQGAHSECEYFQLIAAVNHNAFADEAADMIYFAPSCGCFIADEARHYDYERDEGRIEAMEAEQDAPREGGIETWVTWEADFRPYPGLIKEWSFDGILDRLSNAVYNDLSCPLRRWGDVDLSGHFEKSITFTAFEDAATHIGTMQEFQDVIGRVLATLEVEGHLSPVHRVVNVSRPVQLDSEDED